MRIDLHAVLLSAALMADGEIALTFQVKDPSMRYNVGQTYTISEQLLAEVGKSARGDMRNTRKHRASAARTAGVVKRAGHGGRPTNRARVAKYVAEHGGTKEHAAKTLGIQL